MATNNRDRDTYRNDKIKRGDLAEHRRREQLRKEFEQDLGRDLKLNYEELDQEERAGSSKYRIIDTTIIFFNTLALLYILLFLFKFLVLLVFEKLMTAFGLATAWINPALHALAWTGAIIGVYRKRSILDEFLDHF